VEVQLNLRVQVRAEQLSAKPGENGRRQKRPAEVDHMTLEHAGKGGGTENNSRNWASTNPSISASTKHTSLVLVRWLGEVMLPRL